MQVPMRLPEQPFRVSLSPDAVLAGGVEGYIKAMKAFPVLHEWEIQTALTAHRDGAGVAQLRHMTPFRQYLTIEGYQLPQPPFKGSFTKLFAESSDIPHLVALGIFPTVNQWVHQWRDLNQYPGLPLEEFFQDALHRHIPYSAGQYKPVEGATFRTYAVVLLRQRFSRFVETWQRQQTSPEGYAQGATGLPKEIGKRRAIDSLQRVLPETGRDDFEKPSLSGAPREQTMLDLLDQRSHPESSEGIEKVAFYSVVVDLARTAGLSALEGTVIVGLFVDGLTIAEIAYLLQKPEAQVRDARHRAMKQFRNMDGGTVTAILAGDVSDERERMPREKEMLAIS
jgi:DNA-directed RNA polymerase specialized sigma24 family protein